MSYEPTVWKSGDVVTSAKLNKLEQGVAGGGGGGEGGNGVLAVHSVYDEQQDTLVLDKTGQTILDALKNGQIILYTFTGEEDGTIYEFAQSVFTYYQFIGGKHVFSFSGNVYDVDNALCVIAHNYKADTLNDYPEMPN